MSEEVWTSRLAGRRYVSSLTGKGFQYFGRYNAAPKISLEAWVYDADKRFVRDRIEDSADMLFKVKLGPHQLPNIDMGDGLELFLRKVVEDAIEAQMTVASDCACRE